MPSEHRVSALLATTPPAILIAGWVLLAGLAVPPPACGQETLPISTLTSTTGHLSLEQTRPLGPQSNDVLLGGASPTGLQPVPLQTPDRAPSGATPRWERLDRSPLEGQSQLLRGGSSSGLSAPEPLPGSVDDGERSRFEQTLIGSAVGTPVGGLLGTLLLVASAPDDTRPYENGDDREEVQGTALLIVLGGPPAGAILNTDIVRDNAGA